MADRIRVTSVILCSLPRGERLVSLGGGRRLARSGLLHKRAQAEVPSALRTDTPTLVALADVAGADWRNGDSCRGVADRCAQPKARAWRCASSCPAPGVILTSALESRPGALSLRECNRRTSPNTCSGDRGGRRAGRAPGRC